MRNEVTGMNDTVFKQIFCIPGSENILKKFLEGILQIKINNLIILTPVLPLSRINERQKVVDLLVRADNYVINIEVNGFYYESLFLRNYIYMSAVCASYAEKGMPLSELPDFVQINLNAHLPKYYYAKHYNYKVYDRRHKNFMTKKVTFDTFNIDKIVELYYNKGNREVREDAPPYAKYLIMLILNGEELKEICKGDEMMEKYEKKFNDLTADELANVFLSPEKNEELIRNTIRSEGIAAGLAEGKTQGLAEGKTLGLAEGTANVAKNLLKKNMPFKDIIDVTGLSAEKLKQIQMTL